MKIAKDSNEALQIAEQYTNEPHGKINFKCNEVCCDIVCKCGNTTHVDAEYMYHVKCPHCGSIYLCSTYIELIEVNNVVETEEFGDWIVEPEKNL